jgi:hypothetical protein
MRAFVATKIRILVAVAVLVATPCTFVATASGARQLEPLISLGTVVKAFAKSGLPLINPEAGFMNTVTTLSLANTSYPFTMGVSIYPSVAEAQRSFKGDEGPWREAGYAAALTRNIIVAVVPRGARLGRKATKPFPMPAKVAASIARLG